MGSTTFSGPVKAGTISQTTGTTVGTDMKNVGQVVMAQSLAIDLSDGAITASATDVIIPANSQIVDVVFDIITAASGATNISVGFVGGSATALVNAHGISTNAGRQYPTTMGGALAWEDIGTSDVRLNVTNSAGTSSGEVRLTILYQQDTNYS